MPGNGHIGGGGSYLMDFMVEDIHGIRKWTECDENADEKSTLTITFPKPVGRPPGTKVITLKLNKGEVVEIDWNGFRSGRGRPSPVWPAPKRPKR
jgi:hypothetical protein